LYDANELAPLSGRNVQEGEVYSALRKAIVELYLQPGVILSMKDICEHLSIGRSPVRDALIRLDQEGLVTLLPQKGTMISQIDSWRVEQERFLRISVEEEVMALFMACHTSSDIYLLQDILRRQQECADKEGTHFREFLELDDEFHHLFYRVTDKEFCYQMIQNVSGHYQRMRLLSCGIGDRLREIIDQHNAMITALQSRDTEVMNNLFHLHLRKVDREERLVQKTYPNLFKGEGNIGSANPFWKFDYLQTLKQKKE
jgi:DNA-binding GntR family transcriptional regulator